MRPLIVALALIVLACTSELEPPAQRENTISTAVFTRTMTALAIARAETHPDTAAFEARREAILENHGVSADDLRRFARSHGDDDDVMMRVYDRMRAAIDSLYGRPGTRRAPADTPGP